MLIELPNNLRDEIEGHKIRGIHAYVCEDGTIKKIRYHIGAGKFITQECNIHVGEGTEI